LRFEKRTRDHRTSVAYRVADQRNSRARVE
jgi:hypothetical protein